MKVAQDGFGLNRVAKAMDSLELRGGRAVRKEKESKQLETDGDNQDKRG